MDVRVDDLKEIVRICVGSELQAVYLEIGEVRLALGRGDVPPPFPAPGERGDRPAAAPAEASLRAAGPAAGATPASDAAAPAAPDGPASAPAVQPPPSRPGLFEVRTPLLGVFHRRPAPGEPPFVDLGAEVRDEDAVCLVEVMDRFSRVAAGCRGRVEEICAEDGTMVEYGQVLMRIRPA